VVLRRLKKRPWRAGRRFQPLPIGLWSKNVKKAATRSFGQRLNTRPGQSSPDFRTPTAAQSNPHSARQPSHPTSRAFLHWRLSDDGPGASRIVAMGRHPKPFTIAEVTTFAVGTRVTSRPPHRSVRAAFPHTAPTSGIDGGMLPYASQHLCHAYPALSPACRADWSRRRNPPSWRPRRRIAIRPTGLNVARALR